MDEKRLNTIVVLIAIVMMIPVISGCAFGNRKISLNHIPVGMGTATSDARIYVNTFKDVRDKKILGEVRNGLCIKTASVVAQGQDVGAWISKALADELIKSGCNVTGYNNTLAGDTEIIIDGEVKEAYVKMYLNYKTRITVHVTVVKSGKIVLDKDYIGIAGGAAIFAAASEYEDTLRSALVDLMRRLVPDIMSVM